MLHLVAAIFSNCDLAHIAAANSIASFTHRFGANPLTLPVDYVRHGWILVPIPSGQKGPTSSGWNTRERCVSTPERAAQLTANVGLAHAYSGTCSIDIDDLERAAAYLQKHDIDLDVLLNAPDAVRISSGRANRAKLLYRLATPLTSKKIIEDKQNIIDFRCATRSGTSVQDVLPPSIHPETCLPYTWEYGDEIFGDWRSLPTIPDDLLNLWQSLLDRSQPVNEPPLDRSQPVNLDELRELLMHHDPGCDRDAWVRILAAVHYETLGSADGLELANEWSKGSEDKYSGPQDVERVWRSFHGQGEHLVTAGSLRIQQPADIDDFEPISAIEDNDPLFVSNDKAGERFKPIQWGEFACGKPPRWLVRHVIPQAELVVVYGESGSGKTFLVLDMVACISRGIPWRGLRVLQGPVFYICAEGIGGFRSRSVAYSRQHGIDLALQPFHVIPDAPNFLKGEDALAVAKWIAQMGGAAVIVVDTLSAVTPGANENAGEDMGNVIAHCKGLHRATGAVVVLIHHSGKDAAKGARGWSGLRAAADAEIEVVRHGDDPGCGRSASITKQKDGEDGAAFGFKLNPVLIGVDDEGEDMTSCVIEHTEAPPAGSKPRELGGLESDIYKVLSDMLSVEGGGSSVSVEDLVTGVIKGMVKNESGKDRRRERVRRSLESLVRSKIIFLQDERVSVKEFDV